MANVDKEVKKILELSKILSGAYKKTQYAKVILPLCALRRFDCVLQGAKKEMKEQMENIPQVRSNINQNIIGGDVNQKYFNNSQLTMEEMVKSPQSLKENLITYINAFSPNVKDVIKEFKLEDEIDTLDHYGMLKAVITKFAEFDFSVRKITNQEMGAIFEDLVSKLIEMGGFLEHATARDVTKLMVSLIFLYDREKLLKPKDNIQIYDSCAGVGGTSIYSKKYINRINPYTIVECYGQEKDSWAYAVCKTAELLKEEKLGGTKLGDVLARDHYLDKTFDYMIVDPPQNYNWEDIESIVVREYEARSEKCRFNVGLPDTDDGQLLFLQHLLSKMNPEGSRIALLMNELPLFEGVKGTTPSKIRQHLIENDLIEGIISLPENVHYKTAKQTYIWILTNNKQSNRKGKIQFVDGSQMFNKARKVIGKKYNQITDMQIAEIVRSYGLFRESKISKIVTPKELRYKTLNINRPLKRRLVITDETIRNVEVALNVEQTNTGDIQQESSESLEVRLAKKFNRNIVNVLQNLKSDHIYQTKDECADRLRMEFIENKISVSKAIMNQILEALEEKDPEGGVFDTSRRIPDPELTEQIHIPVSVDTDQYLKEAILPHYPDAWVNEDYGDEWYELPFKKFFFNYTKVIKPEELLDELDSLEDSIREKLTEMRNML